MQIDMRVMELLASKLCHDLVSPVSAINNGVELIEDIGGSVVDEAMKLIGDSGIVASRRLRLYRMAYGRAGSDESLTVRDVRQVAEQYLTGGKISLNWPEGVPAEDIAGNRGFLKTVLNMIILAEEILPYGGVITVQDGGDAQGCRFEIAGRNARLNDMHKGALDGTCAIDNLSPRSIQAYVTGRFASHFGYQVGYDDSVEDRLDFSLSLPAAEQVAAVVNIS